MGWRQLKPGIETPPSPRCEDGRFIDARGVLQDSKVGSFLGQPNGRLEHHDALDGLRGLAVLAVLFSHLSNAGMFPAAALAGTGKSGVYLFFVLSGWLLTRILMGWTAAAWRSPRAWADYALRRILRIWPLYMLLLLISWALVAGGVEAWHYRIDAGVFWRHVTLQEGQSVLWSIPVEFSFYLWLPLVAAGLGVLLRARRPSWALAGAWALAVACAIWRWPPGEALVNDVRLGPYLVVFLCGAWAAAVDRGMAQGRLPRLAPPIWAVLAGAAVVALVVTVPKVWVYFGAPEFNPEVNHRWFLFFGVAWAVLLMSVLHGPTWLRAPMTWAPMRFLGIASFSLYLWHMPIVLWVRDGLGWLGWHGGLVASAASFTVAGLSWYLLERPWRNVRLDAR